MEILKRGIRRLFRADLLVAAGALALFAVCGFPSVNPELWDDLAAAAGLRPAPGVFGGFVRGIDHLVFRLTSPERAVAAIRLFGGLVGAGTAFVATHILKNFCSGWLDSMSASGPVRRAVAETSLAVVTIGFFCSDPVWYAAQGLSAAGLQIFLSALSVWLLQVFVRRRRIRYALISTGLLAVLAADAPVALAGVALAALTVFRTLRRGGDDADALRFANPLVRLAVRRAMTFTVLVLFPLAVMAELTFLRNLGGYDGIEGTGVTVSSYVAYFAAWKPYLLGLATWKAWVLALIAVVCPLVIARLIRDHAVNDEDFLPVSVIVAESLLGLAAWSQLSGFETLRFANWAGDAPVRDRLVGAAFALMSAQTLLWAFLAVASALFMKTPERVAGYRYADAAEAKAGAAVVRALEFVRRRATPCYALLLAAVVITVAPYRPERSVRETIGTIDGFLAETVRECAGKTRVFTDGRLDAGLELAAFLAGTRLYAVSLIDLNTERDRALRKRGLVRPDDLLAAEPGAANLLRTWISDAPTRLVDAAVQIGFEYWRGKGEAPLALGTVALPPGAALPSDAGGAAKRAHGIAEGMLSAYERGRPDAVGPRLFGELYRAVQWRLARIAGLRAEAVGKWGWNDLAENEIRLSRRLNAANSAYQTMRRELDRLDASRSSLLTPFEGLRLCLERADFQAASAFAQSVLAGDPDDPQANFALGMRHFLAGEYAHAEPYLKRCLVKRPDDPAVLNNLAVAELRLCRYADAEKHALAALERLPDNPPILRTLQAVREARAGLNR